MKNFKKLLGVFVLVMVITLCVPNGVNASEKTDEYIRKISPDGKNIVIKSVVPKDGMEADFLMNGIVGKYIDPQDYEFYAWCEGDDFKTCIVELWSDDYKTEWDSTLGKDVVISGEKASYTLNATYDVPTNEVSIVNNYISKLKNIELDEVNDWYMLEDLSLINYYLTSTKSELWNRSAPGRASKFVKELNDITDGSDLNFYLEARMGSQDETLMYESAFGPMTIFYGDYAYAFKEAGLYLKRVIYIPENTANTKEAFIEAAQKRIDDYLGEDNEVTVSYGGLLSSLEEGSEDTELPITSDGNYYNIKVLGRTYKFYIVKANNEKLVEPTYSAKNIGTDISITSDSGRVPLDTKINATKVTSGTEYERILGILDLEDNVTYDVRLYSEATEDYITKLEDGTFEVKIPVPENLKDKDLKDLMVYYVNEEGKTEKYPVEAKDDYVIFTTTHFSIYTLGYKNTTEEPVKVTFDANGGKFGNENTYTINDWTAELYDSLIKPTRKGYTFKGYFTAKTGGTKFEMILNEAGIENNSIYYAQWEKEEENPKTFDGIKNSILIGSISLIILISATIYLTKRNKVRA